MSDASLHPDMLMNRVFAETGLTAAKQLHDISRRRALVRIQRQNPCKLRARQRAVFLRPETRPTGVLHHACTVRTRERLRFIFTSAVQHNDFRGNAFYGIDALSDVMCFVERDDDDTQPQLSRHVIHSAFFNDLHGAAMRSPYGFSPQFVDGFREQPAQPSKMPLSSTNKYPSEKSSSKEFARQPAANINSQQPSRWRAGAARRAAARAI